MAGWGGAGGGVEERPVRARPAACVEDLAGFSVGALGQGLRSSSPDLSPSLPEGGFDPLSQRLQTGEPGSPHGPGDPGGVRGRLGLHHAVQGSFLDVTHEREVLAAGAVRIIGLEPVTEPDAREMAVREQHSDPLPRRLTCEDHFNPGDVIGVMVWLPARQRVTGPRTITDRLDRHRVQRCPPAAADGPACLSPRGKRKDTRTAGIWRRPPLTEGSLDLGALPLDHCSAVLAGCHDRMVAGTSTGPECHPVGGILVRRGFGTASYRWRMTQTEASTGGGKPLCRRCGLPVEASAQDFDVFEQMHYVCFHYEFEHQGDPDVECSAGGCPSSGIRLPAKIVRTDGVDLVQAGNTVVPAILALEANGYAVSQEDNQFVARAGNVRLAAEDPVAVPGLVKLAETRRPWRASNSETDDVMSRFHL